MPEQKLKETLDALHAELASADDLDAEEQERLRSALEEIRGVLEKQREEGDEEGPGMQEGAGEPDGALTDRLSQSASHFEQTHPTLAGTVRRLIDVLAQMGI